MTSRPASQSAASIRLTMLPDPPETERDMLQFPHIAAANLMLEGYFRHILGREDVLVGSEGYLCRRAGEARTSPHPDLVVALGTPVPPEIIMNAGNGYTIDEIGQSPDFVLEVASATTAENDETTKRAQYAEMGVGEYWRFDWSDRRYYRAPLAGDVLVEGEYRPIPVEEGEDGLLRGHSPALGLDLVVHPAVARPVLVGPPPKWQLRFYDPAREQYLEDLPQAWARANAESRRADAADARIRQLEEENRRLRAGE